MRIPKWLFSVVLFFLMLEGGLQVFDPVGIMGFQRTLNRLIAISEDHANLYALQPGTHMLNGWQMTVGESGYRVVNDERADCTIAVLGDSVTMGWRVDDGDVWVNRVHVDGVHLINTAVYAYNITNIRRAVESTPADAYLYYWTDNDIARLFDYQRRTSRFVPATLVYILRIVPARVPAFSAPLNVPAFNLDLASILQRDNVVIAGNAGDPVYAWLLDQYNVDGLTIDGYGSRISPGDEHPDRVGHQQIAAEMTPILEAMRQNLCLRGG